MRRLQAVSTLQEVAFEIANEGCRYLNADRVSVLIRRGKRWQLLAASGVERIEPRADAVKQLQQLAAVTANWNDVIHYSQSQPNPALDDLPPRVADCLHRHIDQSHARSLVAVPLEFPTTKAHAACQAVLIAEHFGNLQELNPRQVVELAWLSSPALQQAKGLNSLPARALLGGSKWWSRLWENWGPSRLLLGLTGTALAVAALIYVPCDFEIEAPATLVPIVQQDIFATTSGTVRRVLVEHGERVEKGEAMAILADPQLALESERVRGEIETATKRLEAIAVARTDRQVREEPTGDGLPLSAEAQQLELRLASLQLQAKILRGRHEALTLRSPLAGMVLTLDVQHRLRSRPVERGQILFTVADDRSGWKLESRVPQDQIGHVLTAQDELGESLAVRFKLAGDAEQIYQGKLSKILETTVLDPQSLDAELPDVQVEVAVTDDSLPSAKPQMAARARFACGQRSLGYVWLHDAWDHIYAWLKF
mgnify:FL=1